MLKNISIQDAQDVAFDLFQVFKRLCEAHDLRYYLSGGTLLGAVRHQGFIPWDDDVDVMMPREDYDKLLSLRLDLPEHIQLFACEVDEAYFYPFAKLSDMRYKLHFEHHKDERSIGMYIDIFPIEGLPDAQWKAKLYFKRMRLLDILRNAALKRNYLPGERYILLKKLLTPIIVRKNANEYAKKMNALGRSIPLGSSEHAGVTMVTHYGMREYMRREIFLPGDTKPFRTLDCAVPKGWDSYLTQLYGDYMQLPPEEKRHSDHITFTIELREDAQGAHNHE